MQQIWARIETVLGRIAPKVLAAMPPGATEEEIEAVEAVMGVELPEDVRDSYRCHDGLPGPDRLARRALLARRDGGRLAPAGR